MVIIAVVSLAIAGIHAITVKNKTEIYIVADMSYSTDKDAEMIDGYIKNIINKENLPQNATAGVVCFGKDFKINTPLGGEFISIANTEIDSSATDISGALDYTSGLFSGDAIKRIVLITDGKQNTSGDSEGMLNSIKNMETKNILVDAVYIDSNLESTESEVQITEIKYVKSTYLNEKTELSVLIRSNTDYIPNPEKPKDKNDAFVRLYDGEGNLIDELSKPLSKGYNLVTFPLDTSKAQVTDYRVCVDASHDTTLENNEYTFTQEVTEEYRVLLISRLKSDYDKAKKLYGETAVIDAPLIDRQPVPYTLEDLCRYDVFILSDIDVKTIDNGVAFVTSLNTAVSKFGKTLITAGNTYVQNKDEQIYEILGGMAAVDYGNSGGDAKLYAIVIDTSRSMQDAYQLIMAKDSAIQLLDLMMPGDQVMVVSFSGEATLVTEPVDAVKNKEAIVQAIEGIKPTQGTVLGAGLRMAYEYIKDRDGFIQKQVLLISDGRSYEGINDKDDPLKITKEMFQSGIYTSTINTNSPVGADMLKQIAKIGQGGVDDIGYFFIETPEQVKGTVSTDVADTLYETIIIGDTPVSIVDYSEPLVKGMSHVPNIGGYFFARKRSDTVVVLEASYEVKKGVYVPVPIYSYKQYEKGTVISLSTKLSGEWVANWETDSNGILAFTRMLTENVPSEKIDYPFTFNVEYDYDGSIAKIEIIPGETNPDITVDLEIISPSEEKTVSTLYYKDGVYTMNYEIKESGKYYANIAYTYGEKIFPACVSFDIAYLPEYNRFEFFDSALLYNSIGVDGTVSEDGQLNFEVDDDKAETQTTYFIVPLMIIAVVLYVVDIAIRKLKWSDIKSFFSRKKIGGAK